MEISHLLVLILPQLPWQSINTVLCLQVAAFNSVGSD